MGSTAPDNESIERYVVIEYLAEGGMGAIFVGKKLGAGGFEKPVVLKQLLPEFTSQPEFIELFLREARLSATLDHANIIHTIDLVTAGEEHFMVMEYLAGADLRTLLQKSKRRGQRLSPAAGIFITRETLSALAYAHAKVGNDGKPLELIHRDVSPSNILVSRNGEVKLTDFGIAKAATHNSVFYRVAGKIGYMSPEQARNEPLDNRSDLYSLAVCFYEMLTGERLFVRVGLTMPADEIFSQPVPAVSEKVPGLPPALDQVLFKALALDPAQRFQTAGEFQEALLRCAHHAGLMLSAPELASHLLETCGDPSQWRDPASDTVKEEGTAILDEDGAQQLGDGDGAGGQHTSITKLGELQRMELTSMIHATDSPDTRGSAPLVNLDELGPAPEQSAAMPLAADSMGFRESDIDLSKVPLRRQRSSAGSGAGAESTAARAGAPDAAESATSTSRRGWSIWILILLLGLVAAAAVGLSGPGLGDRAQGEPGAGSAIDLPHDAGMPQ